MENIKPSSAEWFYGPRWLGFASGYKPGSYAGFHGWVYDKTDDAEESKVLGGKRQLMDVSR